MAFIKTARHIHTFFNLKEVSRLSPTMKQDTHGMRRFHAGYLFKALQGEIRDVLKWA